MLSASALALACLLSLSCLSRRGNCSSGGLSGCEICHTAAADACARSKHTVRRVTCVTCHGPSRAHLEDENNAVKPDRVFTRQNTDAFCCRCHYAHCPHAGTKGRICTDCHGAHGTRVPKPASGGP